MSADRRRGYSRLDRVNQALREVVADELELIGDDRLELVTITGVRVSADLRHAVVWFSALTRAPGLAPGAPAGPSAHQDVEEGRDEVSALLGEHRVRLQGAVARQLRLKRTPELEFRPDPAIDSGTRVEDILRGLGGSREDWG